MTVAADPDPYFALPKLYGAPAYSRGPRAVPDSERPFDPDDMPIAAAMTDDERAFARMLSASAAYSSIGSRWSPSDIARGSRVAVGGSASATGAPGPGVSRFSLRILADRLGPRSK